MNSRWLIVGLFFGCVVDKVESEEEGQVQTDVVSIRIEPEHVDLSTSADAAATVQFIAHATNDEGLEFETDMITWETSNLSAGEIDENGLFSANTRNGGLTEIKATHVGIEATASITIVYAQDIVEGELEVAVADAFAGASPSEGDTPAISYPHDGVTVPRNLNGLAFEWSSPIDANVSRLQLQSGITDVSVYTMDRTWYATSDLWALISAANTGGEVDIHVETGVWDGSTLTDVWQGPSLTLTVNRLDARGSVLYWVARTEEPVGDPGGGGTFSGPTGDIMRIPFGSTESEFFWTSEDAAGSCTGCHTLSEASNQMVVTNDGVNGTFTIIDLSDPEDPTVAVWPEDHRRATFHTASPDGTKLLAVYDGRAFIYSLTTGNQISEIPTEGYRVSHPDWAPDGEDILLVRVTATSMNDMNFEGGEIIQMSYDDGAFGPAEVLVARDDEYNNYYPAYAPDGEWIVFNRGYRTEITDPAGGTSMSSTCYANPSAELWLMRRDGSGLTRLDNANGEGEKQNSFPRWGPLPDDDVLWLAYSSMREYSVDPNSGDPQIWVSAIEPARVDQGEDPSSPPFWLPAQDSQSDNHLAIWWSK